LWTEQHTIVRDGTPLRITDIHYRAFDAAANAALPPSTLDPGGDRVAAVASNASGNFVALYYSRPAKLLAQRFDAAGRPVGAPVTVLDPASENPAAVAMDAAGDFVVVYDTGFGGSGGLYAEVFGPSGDTPKVRPFVVQTNSFTASPTSYAMTIYAQPAVAMDAAGDVVVAYVKSFTDLFSGNYLPTNSVLLRRFSASGTPLGGEQTLDTEPNFASVSSPSVAADGAGHFVVAWATAPMMVYGGGTGGTGSTSGGSTSGSGSSGSSGSGSSGSSSGTSGSGSTSSGGSSSTSTGSSGSQSGTGASTSSGSSSGAAGGSSSSGTSSVPSAAAATAPSFPAPATTPTATDGGPSAVPAANASPPSSSGAGGDARTAANATLTGALAQAPPGAAAAVTGTQFGAASSSQATAVVAGAGAGPLGVKFAGSPDTQLRFGPEASRPGDISGVVYLDDNANGVREPGERGLAGQKVFIDLDGDGRPGPGEPITVTNERGEYLFRGLPLNRTYQVRQQKPQFILQTYPNRDGPNEVRLSDDRPSAIDVNFGAVPVRPARPPIRPARTPEKDLPPGPPTPSQPVKPADAPGTPDNRESRNDAPPPGASDAVFQAGTFWRAAAVPVALLAGAALGRDGSRRRAAGRRREGAA
jgi:hypothetical protein